MTEKRQRKRTLARELALQLLYIADANGSLSDDEMEHHFRSTETQPDVAEFAAKLVRGALDARTSLDEIIAQTAVNWKLSRMSVVDRNILRMAAYEIIHLADIPPKVSINEAVDLAKKYSTADSGAFVNGILDKILTGHGAEKAKK